MKKRIGIIGGGPAGLMAAIKASEYNDVIVFEKNDSCGKKLLMTGNGRCNITNNKSVKEFLDHCNKNSKFLYSALNTFGPSEIINFFNSNGCALKEEDENRMFPVSNKATDILNTLMSLCKDVEFKYNHTVSQIVMEDNHIKGVMANYKFFKLDALIICSGGISYPSTGSTGDGYNFLKQCGHTVTELKPCEVSLKSDNEDILNKSLMGLSIAHKLVEVVVANKVIAKRRGDLMFTHFGLSGPVILNLSEVVLEHNDVEIRINNEIDGFYGFERSRKKISVPRRYWDYIIKDIEMKPLEQISKKDKEIILNKLKYQSYKITGSLGIERAIITNGGVNCNEFDRKTLGSKLIDNLYVCGEVLDVHGAVGGYNLTLALSSGYLVGSAID
jgi:predicted Rossmann fold flavoprotein